MHLSSSPRLLVPLPRPLLLALFTLFLATPSQADSTATTEGGGIFVCPAGDGMTLAEGGATVTVTMVDEADRPIVGMPAHLLTLDGPQFALLPVCGNDQIYADGPTDGRGQTTFSGTWPGGSWKTDGLQVTAHGDMLPVLWTVGPVLPIEFTSPDSNGDFVVDLADVGRFALDFLDPSEPLRLVRSDFNQDETLNLIDVGILVDHLGHHCP